jgi:arylsulfatase A-like enzyme
MIPSLRRALLVAGLVLAALPAPAVHAQSRPRLLVIVSIDQMRADYIGRYGQHWTGGLRRLVDHGAFFTEASFPYQNTITCAGHATMSTGTFPAAHGMVLNAWWDRASGTQVTCTFDPATTLVGVEGDTGLPGDSAARMRMPALADELRAQSGTPPRVVALSNKARSAITLGGRRGDLVLWAGGAGGFVTSTAYGAASLAPMAEYLKANPISADYGKTWTRLLRDDQYLFVDEGVGEPEKIWPRVFPKPIESPSGQPDADFYTRWATSPFADAYLARLAVAALERLRLGEREGATDLLAVSFSMLDAVGHMYGPRSHEVQDTLARLDLALAILLDALDARVGRENYVLALTGDHGVSPIPEQALAEGLDAGRVNTRDMAARANTALAGVLGEGTHVAAMYYTDLYFAPGVAGKVAASPEAWPALRDAIESTPGVYRAVRREDLVAESALDPLVKAAALSYDRERSGDVLIIPRPYWITSAAVATHGTLYRYDTRVPLIFYGAGVRPGRYTDPSTPADVAVTLAWRVGVTLPRPDGLVRARAFVDVDARAPESGPDTARAHTNPE